MNGEIGRKGFHPCCHSERIHYKHTRAEKDVNVRAHTGMHKDKHTQSNREATNTTQIAITTASAA